MNRFPNGTVVAFAFALYRVTLSEPIIRRNGVGVVIDNTDYSVWPVGYTIHVTTSPDYPANEIVHVSPEHVTATKERP